MSKKAKLIPLAALAITTGVTIQRSKELKRIIPKIDKPIYNVLVLGSGGVLGVAWHAATLLRMERLGLWHPSEDSLRIGTSAGSMVAVALGSEIPAQKILGIVMGNKIDCNGEEIVMPLLERNPSKEKERSDKWYATKSLSHLRMPYSGLLMSSLLPTGEANMDELIKMVNAFSGNKWPDIETWVTSTDYVSGRRHIFDKNSNVTPGFAVASSCAIPSIYKPLEHNEQHFIDGGIISMLHLDLAMRLGAKKITVLAPLSGFVKLNTSDPLILTVKKIARNAQELALLKAKIKAKSFGIEFIIIRPRRLENQLLNKGSLMDSTLLPELVDATLN